MPLLLNAGDLMVPNGLGWAGWEGAWPHLCLALVPCCHLDLYPVISSSLEQ